MNYFSPAGLKYQQWYDQFSEDLVNPEMKDDTGTLNRFGDSVLKVAMLLSLSRSPELYIDEASMQTAIEYCQSLVGSVRQMTYGKKGLSESKNIKGLIIEKLLARESHRISRTMLLKDMWSHYKEANEMDEIMLSFDQSNLIKTESIGNQIIYVMPDDVVKDYQKFFSGKRK